MEYIERIKMILEKWRGSSYVNDVEKAEVVGYLFDEIEKLKQEVKNGRGYE